MASFVKSLTYPKVVRIVLFGEIDPTSKHTYEPKFEKNPEKLILFRFKLMVKPKKNKHKTLQAGKTTVSKTSRQM